MKTKKSPAKKQKTSTYGIARMNFRGEMETIPGSVTPKRKKPFVPVSVDRKFLLKLADHIYNPRTKKYLNLCTGELRKGKDPTNPQRSMHCALGELYFAMTDCEPTKAMDEDEVIDLAVRLSPLPQKQEERHALERGKFEELKAVIRKLKLKDNNLDVDLYDRLDRAEDDLNDEDNAVEDFRRSLEEIMNVNDETTGTTPSNYKDRAKCVAAQFRVAAKLLPAK